jgi:hypothetical protein
VTGHYKHHHEGDVLSVEINGGDKVEISRRMFECLVHPESNVRNEEDRVGAMVLLWLMFNRLTLLLEKGTYIDICCIYVSI